MIRMCLLRAAEAIKIVQNARSRILEQARCEQGRVGGTEEVVKLRRSQIHLETTQRVADSVVLPLHGRNYD